VDNLKVSIYIKSQFRGNPRGAGEAAAVIEYIDKTGSRHVKTVKVEIEEDTKNALALRICITALRSLIKPCEAIIYIDCEYIDNAHRQGWVKKWQQDDWKRANNKPPANLKEWQLFYALSEIHKIEFEKYNDRYDGELEKMLRSRLND
jgi:ribonuclease HI